MYTVHLSTGKRFSTCPAGGRVYSIAILTLIYTAVLLPFTSLTVAILTAFTRTNKELLIHNQSIQNIGDGRFLSLLE